MVKNLPARQVRSLGWEGPLEKEMATHSSFLAWRIPWTEEPGGLHNKLICLNKMGQEQNIFLLIEFRTCKRTNEEHLSSEQIHFCQFI